MTNRYRLIRAVIVSLFLVAVTVSVLIANKRNTTPASADVVETFTPATSVVGDDQPTGPIVVRDKGGTVKYQPLTSTAPVAPRNPYVGVGNK